VRLLCGRDEIEVLEEKGRLSGENERWRCLNSCATVSGTRMFWTWRVMAVSVIPGKTAEFARGVLGEDTRDDCSSSSGSSLRSDRRLPRVEILLIPLLKAGIPASSSLDMTETTLPRLGNRERLAFGRCARGLSDGAAPPV